VDGIIGISNETYNYQDHYYFKRIIEDMDINDGYYPNKNVGEPIDEYDVDDEIILIEEDNSDHPEYDEYDDDD
jgi:hypothetical protein